MEQCFAKDYLVFRGCSFFKSPNISFTFILTVCCFLKVELIIKAFRTSLLFWTQLFLTQSHITTFSLLGGKKSFQFLSLSLLCHKTIGVFLISREKGECVYGFAFIFRLHSPILLLTVYIVIAISSSNLFIVKTLIMYLPCFY